MPEAYIQCRTESLKEDEEIALRNWLKLGQFSKLKQVLRGRAQVHLSEVANKAAAADPANSYGAAADAEMVKARRYTVCLEVLEEIVNSKEPLKTVKLS